MLRDTCICVVYNEHHNRTLIAVEYVVLVGDFNAKLGKDIIPQDIDDMSSDTKHILNLINNFELVTNEFL